MGISTPTKPTVSMKIKVLKIKEHKATYELSHLFFINQLHTTKTRMSSSPSQELRKC